MGRQETGQIALEALYWPAEALVRSQQHSFEGSALSDLPPQPRRASLL